MNPQILNNALEKMGKALAKNGPIIAKKVGGAAIAAIIAVILTSRYKDKGYKELMKKHDKETAERLSKEWSHKLDALKKEYKDEKIKTKEEFKQKVIELCREYGIDPKNVLKVTSIN